MLGRLILSLLLAWVVVSRAEAGCADQPDPCEFVQGTYHVQLPDASAGGEDVMPAIVFLHGYGGSGKGSLSITGMTKAFLGQGYAVIAPDGQPRTGRRGRTWMMPPWQSPHRDDVAFVAAVADDAARRFGLDRGRMVLAGFSLGGSMASYVACIRPDAFSAYAPVAGSFWRPMPEACTGPVRLFHTHGKADTTVPLAGRLIRAGLEQADVFRSLEVFRQADGCGGDPVAVDGGGTFEHSRWPGCNENASIDLALHPGGHGVPTGWAEMILEWLGRRG